MTDRPPRRRCDRTTKPRVPSSVLLSFWSATMLLLIVGIEFNDRAMIVGAFVIESEDVTAFEGRDIVVPRLLTDYPAFFDDIFASDGRVKRDHVGKPAIRVSAVIRAGKLSSQPPPRRRYSNGSSTRVISTLDKSIAATSSTTLCLGIEEIFIALILVLLILTTVLGNVLVMLSVFLYKRMRTFNNFLLTSLATADLLVGLLIMPLSLVDLLYSHRWPFGRLLCSIWATTDVLLCTASILNLCIISLDRYMAITSPLKYPRTRSRLMAIGLLCFVWGVAMIVCSPPWLIPEWGLFFNHNNNHESGVGFMCAYSPSVPYRIYSALVSFYIPLIIMLFVYFKIFRVASEREKLMRQNLGTCRLSRRVEKTQRRYKLYNNHYNSSVCAVEVQRKKSAVTSNNYHTRCASEPMSHIREVRSAQRLYFPSPTEAASDKTTPLKSMAAGGGVSTANNHCWNSVADFPHCSNAATQPVTKNAQSTENGSRSCTELNVISVGIYRSNGRNDSCDPDGLGCMRKSLSSGDTGDKQGNKPNFSITVQENIDRQRPDSLYIDGSDYHTSSDKRLQPRNNSQLTPNSLSSYGDLIDEATFPDCVELATSLNNSYTPIIVPSGTNSASCSQRRTKITEILENEHRTVEKINHQPSNSQPTVGQLPKRTVNEPEASSTASFVCGSPPSTSSSIGGAASHRPFSDAKTAPGNYCNSVNPSLKGPNGAEPSISLPNQSNHRWCIPKANRMSNHLQPVNLLAKAQQHYNTNGPGKNVRGSKEKIVYLRERKALKTIGIVVLGFIICWMPFFVLYILQVVITNPIIDSNVFKLVYEFFLWLGYSNSVLNPIIYTMYNGDFRRCFRDLLGFGCVQQHRRTMSVKKLHQQSTVF